MTLTDIVVDTDPELQKLVVITAPVKKVLDRGSVEALTGESSSSKFQ
jgi:hypothetical protein